MMTINEFKYYLKEAESLKESDLKNLALVFKSIQILNDNFLFDQCLVLFLEKITGEESLTTEHRTFKFYKQFIQNQCELITFLDECDLTELKKKALLNYFFIFKQFSIEG